MLKEPQRILIVTKYRFIGDTLTAVPTFRAVKEKWPDAEVSLLSGARACELMQNCPYLDRFIEFDPYRDSDKGIAQYLKLIGRLRRQKFDLAFVLNRSFHSALTAALCCASRRAGWSGFEGRDFLLTDGCVYDRDKPEIDCFHDLYRAITGSKEEASPLQLWLTQPELSTAAKHLPEGDFILGVQPGATHEYKQWHVSRFVSLCDQLVERHEQIRIVLFGGPEEKSVADRFMRDAPPALSARTTDLVGRLPLRLTLAALSQLSAFIGNDTAIRHAAIALDVPSIGLFGPTSSSKWGNAQPPRHVVAAADTRVMDDLSVQTVFNFASAWRFDAPKPIAVGAPILDSCQQAYLDADARTDRAVADMQLVLERSTNE